MQIAAISSNPAPRANELHVAQFNVENMFDTVDNPNRRDTVVTQGAYDVKLRKLALAIRDQLGSPDVLALEEVENQGVLDDLLKRPELAGLGYRAIVLAGNDLRGINVGMLYRSGTIDVTSATQANTQAINGLAAALPNPGDQVDPHLLFARPPLIVDATFHAAGLRGAEAGQQLTFIINHFKSKMGGPANDPRREQQAAFVAGLVDARTGANPNANVIVLGDLNTNENEKSFQQLVTRADGSVRLTSATAGLAPDDRYSWGRPKQHDLFDHLLLTGGMQAALTSAHILHFNTTAPKGSASNAATGIGVSDHDPILATFLLK